MDGSTVEHSDSDSGDSWTLLENNPTYGDDAPDFSENLAVSNERYNIEAPSEKDEDTDGISIISDSDPEPSPSDVRYDKNMSEETRPADESSPLLPSTPTNDNHNQEPVTEETDFLGDNIKFKTYVHKRNPRVGTILDIIMLGTFVITAGMALGHLWSCKNECTTQPSVNKILSNLYKLQEENAYLRNKLKEVTQNTGYQLSAPHKTDMLSLKQHRCKKRFEEPVIKNKLDGAIKCVDDKPDTFQNPLPIPEHEKEFLNDVNNMRNIYNQNKVWIDKEVKKQFEKFDKLNNAAERKNAISHKQINLKKQLGPLNIALDSPQILQETKLSTNKNTEPVPRVIFDSELIQSSDNNGLKVESANIKNVGKATENQVDPVEMVQEKKITYADSLKSDQPMQKSQSNDNSDSLNRYTKDHISKRKHKNNDIVLNLNSLSEDDIKKDDRYNGPKIKHEKKKHDRQKSHKKQKRSNKYEQWEMKGGYLKDYDEFSVTSSQDNFYVQNPDRKFLNPEFENYLNKVTEMDNNASVDKDQTKILKKFNDKTKVEKRSLKNDIEKKKKIKDSEWFDKRTTLRAEARMKLEQELFGENTSNNAAWYFRRMQKREQCRAQKDNSTFKKFSKRKMNFKMKR